MLPPYIALTSAKGRFSDEGFLGPAYKPFVTGGNPAQTPFLVEGIIAKGITERRQESRRALLQRSDRLRRTLDLHPEMQAALAAENEAYEIMQGEARELFNLGNETDGMRQRYGMNTLGQACLLARRLVESGVRYVSINARGWDTHKSHFIAMNRMLPELDRGVSNLLDDLSARGLLESTLVWCCGDFGRTPRILWNDPWKGGRGHYGQAFSALVAGGGFQGGAVVGATDARGETVIERPVSPQDFIGSLYTLAGIDPDGSLPNPMGRDLTLLPPSEGSGRLNEIM